jgi:hypothetical protein
MPQASFPQLSCPFCHPVIFWASCHIVFYRNYPLPGFCSSVLQVLKKLSCKNWHQDLIKNRRLLSWDLRPGQECINSGSYSGSISKCNESPYRFFWLFNSMLQNVFGRKIRVCSMVASWNVHPRNVQLTFWHTTKHPPTAMSSVSLRPLWHLDSRRSDCTPSMNFLFGTLFRGKCQCDI